MSAPNTPEDARSAEYVAALERVAELAARLMAVGYDDGPEEIALCEALAEAHRLQHSDGSTDAR
jgi:hypothetical protein